MGFVQVRSFCSSKDIINGREATGGRRRCFCRPAVQRVQQAPVKQEGRTTKQEGREEEKRGDLLPPGQNPRLCEKRLLLTWGTSSNWKATSCERPGSPLSLALVPGLHPGSYEEPARFSTYKMVCLPNRSESESRSAESNSLQPHGLYSPWNSPGQNTGVGCHSLLQGIFPTQESNPGLPHCRQILYQLSHQGRPRIY